MKQIPLAISAPSQPSFATLVVGPNVEAVQHLATLLPPAAPVYLWGPSGSGKTHLLAALAARRQAEGERIEWFDAAAPLPWGLADDASVVLLDQCDALDAERQAAAFSLYVDAESRQVQWAAAGRLPPVDLALRDDLRSRLGWGHVFALQPLGEGEARAALRREADHRGIRLGDDVMDYLLTRFERNLKHLMRLLDRLDDFALAEHRAITVPLLKKMLDPSEPA